jgi:hypothetical protein
MFDIDRIFVRAGFDINANHWGVGDG